MSQIAYNCFMTIKDDWKKLINEIYIEWRGSSRGTISQFADEVCKAPQPVVSGWLNYGAIPTNRYVGPIAERYPLVYEVLKIPRPVKSSVDDLLTIVPEEIRSIIMEARSEYSAELARRGMDTDSPEARQIVIDAFEKRGIKVSVTE